MEQQNTYPAGTLPAQGFRFIRSNGLFAWVHPAAACGVAYANHQHEAREALTREPGKALRNPHSERCPTIRASDLLESLSYEQQAALAEVLSRAAMAGDAQALRLIDQLAAEHAERNSLECDE